MTRITTTTGSLSGGGRKLFIKPAYGAYPAYWPKVGRVAAHALAPKMTKCGVPLPRVQLRDDGGESRYARCKHVGCPWCYQHDAGKARQELLLAARRAGDALLLEMDCGTGDDAAALLDAERADVDALNERGSFKRALKEADYVDRATRTELRRDGNRWRVVHYVALLFTRKLTVAERERIARTSHAAVYRRDPSALADAIAPGTTPHDPSSTWGLLYAAERGDRRAAELWREFFAAIGDRKLRRKLKNSTLELLGLRREKRRVLAVVDPESWDQIERAMLVQAAHDAARALGQEGVDAIVRRAWREGPRIRHLGLDPPIMRYAAA